MTAKPTGSTPTVNAALVHRQFAPKVNVAKSKLAPMSECAFLGFTIKGKKIRWTDKALADFKHRIKELTGRSWGVSMEYRLRKLGQYQPRAASLVTAAHRRYRCASVPRFATPPPLRWPRLSRRQRRAM